MSEKGYLDGTKMATAFNMLRSGDLIWPYVVNNYMRGKDPLPFDLLYWNADSTRMAAANHSFYLRNCYLENNLSQGRMELAGRKRLARRRHHPGLQPRRARRPHRAGALGVPRLAVSSAATSSIVMAGSGHIAGVVNPPASEQVPVLDRWASRSANFPTGSPRRTEHPGSWWPHWQQLDRGRADGRA